MFFIPGYVDYFEKNGVVWVTSNLYKNTVKLYEPETIAEFKKIIQTGGCDQITTQLTKFLHEQELLVDEFEMKQSIEQLHTLMEESLLVTIMPTEGCNFRCPYCYENHMPISMSRNTMEQIWKFLSLQATKFKHIQIGWFGGEPTLCKEIILETSALLQKLQEKYHFIYTSNMTTNGYLLDCAAFQKYYRAGITDYQITLDGWNHDLTRPHISGKGSLQKILDNLKDISSLPQDEYGFKITLRHNILPGDEDYSWYDQLFCLFGTDVRFSILVRPVGDWGGDSVHSMTILGGDERDTLVLKHIEYIKKIGMQCDNGTKAPFSKICYASYPHSMVFRAAGKVEKCTVCLDHPRNAIGVVDPKKGVVLDEQLNQLWTSLKLKAECFRCADVLSCLNMQCPKKLIVDGDNHGRCTQALSDIY